MYHDFRQAIALPLPEVTATVATLNNRTLTNLTRHPPSIRTAVRDGTIGSLYARVTPHGVATFSWHRWVGGRARRLTIGRWPACTLDAARAIARRKDEELAVGLDVVPARGGATGKTQLTDIWESYRAHSQLHRKRPDDAISRWKHLKRLADRPIGSISRDDVERWHQGLALSAGKVAANRCLALLSALYTRAKRLGFRGDNPCTFVTRFAEKPRTRVLQDAEIPELGKSLAAEKDKDVRDFIVLGLATGARRGNIAAMKWSDLDLQAGTWSIAAAEAKNGLPLTLPLGTDALTLLRERAAQRRESSDFVFPARRTSPKSPFQTSWQPRVRRVLDRAGLKDVRFHDLRRTFATSAFNGGIDIAVVSAYLGHKQISTTAKTYAHAGFEQMRAASNRATKDLRAVTASSTHLTLVNPAA